MRVIVALVTFNRAVTRYVCLCVYVCLNGTSVTYVCIVYRMGPSMSESVVCCRGMGIASGSVSSGRSAHGAPNVGYREFQVLYRMGVDFTPHGIDEHYDTL